VFGRNVRALPVFLGQVPTRAPLRIADWHCADRWADRSVAGSGRVGTQAMRAKYDRYCFIGTELGWTSRVSVCRGHTSPGEVRLSSIECTSPPLVAGRVQSPILLRCGQVQIARARRQQASPLGSRPTRNPPADCRDRRVAWVEACVPSKRRNHIRCRSSTALPTPRWPGNPCLSSRTKCRPRPRTADSSRAAAMQVWLIGASSENLFGP
jgi:hypothetical protein